MKPAETFEQACAGLLDFLRRDHQFSGELLWLLRGDVTGTGRRFFVRSCPSSDNRDLYERYYAYGVRQGRGISLVVLFYLGNRACSYIWIPRDDIEAGQAMMSDGLKLSIPDGGSGVPFIASECHSAFGFLFRSIQSQFRGVSPILQEIPTRSDLHSTSNN